MASNKQKAFDEVAMGDLRGRFFGIGAVPLTKALAAYNLIRLPKLLAATA